MGCDCCQIDTPERYQKCQDLSEALTAKHRSAIAPCGGTDIGYREYVRGSNYTAPKKKRKRRK